MLLYGRIRQDAPPCASSPNTDCRGSTSLARVTEECGGKSSCTVQASNSVFGDPCGGTEKYLDVLYECREPDLAAAVGIWPLNRQHEANDTSGNGHNATPEGTQLGPGVKGEASGSYSFSGSEASFLRVANGGVFGAAGSFTVLLNIYPTGESGTLVSFSDGLKAEIKQANSTTLVFNILPSSVTLTLEASVLTLNAWNYLGVSYDYTTGVAMVWHEGIPVAKSNVGRLDVSTQGDLIIGKQNTSSEDLSPFGGRMSCLQVYGAALGRAEVGKAREACDGGNVALGRAASQSSSAAVPGRDTSAGQAVDGYLGTTVHPGDACAATDRDSDPWWLVDLGTVSSVGTVRVLTRADCCGERLQNLQVRVGDSPDFLLNQACGAIYTGTPSGGKRLELHCREGTAGQYVSVQTVKTTDQLSLCEVEVFPEADVSPPLACGETTLFVTETQNGTLSSPSFGTGTYPPNSACRWLLTAPQDGIIVLNIVLMDLQDSADCTSDFVVVYDGPSPSYPVLGRLCGTAESVLTSGSQMFVEFVSDGETESSGFMATFTAVSPDENIASGKSASQAADLSANRVAERAVDADVATCAATSNLAEPWWKLDLGAAYSVMKVRLYTNGNDTVVGEMNNFQVRVGDDTDMSHNSVCGPAWTDRALNDDVIDISCGDAILGRYVSVQIEGRADSLRLCEVDVFLEQAEASPTYECGETSVFVVSGDYGLLSTSGNVTNQNSDSGDNGFGSDYSVSSNCSWLISARDGGLLTFTFTTFDLPDSAGCAEGYVAVYDGANSQAPLLGRYCGGALSPALVSLGTLFVQFVTYGRHLSTFSATFAAGKSRNLALMKSAEQSATLVRGGTPLSAGLAVDGNNGADAQALCAETDVTDQPWWRVDLGGVYLVQRVRVFGGSEETLQDVQVRVGTDPDVRENAVCGTTFSDGPDSGNALELDCGLAIAGRYVTVQIRAHRRSLRLCEVQVFPPAELNAGFIAEMGPDVLESAGAPLVSANSAANTADDSSDTYWAPSPTSGSYGSVLYDLRQPYWLYYIRVLNFGDGDHYVTSFTLESSETGQDYTAAANFTFTQGAAAEVFDGFFARGRYWRLTVTGVVGGSEPWVAEIQLYGTPGWVQSLGCWTDRSSRAIQPLEGTDPLLSDAYQSRQQPLEKCYTVSRGLGYSVFALQNGGWCASTATAQDTYQRYGASSACAADGEGGGYANEVYQIIDEDHNPYMSSFLSNDRMFTCGSGPSLFVLSWNDSTIGQMLSPNHGSGSYPGSSACSWLISAGSAGQVSLNFTDFSLENSSECSNDYVAVYDGPGRSSRLLGNFCGNEGPGLVTSTAEHLFVVFRSDDSLELQGFVADIIATTVSKTVPECYPDITLAGGGPTMDEAVSVERPVPFTIQALTDVTCNETYTVEFQWAVYSIVEGSVQWTNVSVPTNYPEILIPKNTLGPGLVRLDLNATVVVARTGARNSLVGTRWVEVVLSPLVSSISGGSARAVSRAEDLVLSAAASYDPNGIVTESAGFNFTWSCLDENGRPCGIFTDGGRGQQYRIPPASLPVSSSVLNISVAASSGRQTASPFRQRVELRNGTVLEVDIIDCNQRANPSERLVLLTSCRNCPASSTAYQWSLSESPPGVQIEGADWSGLLSTTSTAPSLVLKANSLKVPGTYRVRLDVSAPGEAAGFTECVIDMDSAPESGACAVQPASGTAEFSVVCEGFSDTDMPLTYSLYQRSDSYHGFLQFLSSWPDGQLPAMLLPVGSPSGNFSYGLEVHVSDARGAAVISNSMPVQVPLPSEEETSFLLGNLSSSLAQLADRGDARGILNLVQRVCSILNTNTFTGQMKNTATEARIAMARSVQLVAEQVQTWAGSRQLSSVMAALSARGDQMAADLQTDVVEMMTRVVTYLRSQPKEVLGPHRLEEAAGSVFSAAANIIAASLMLSNVSNSTSSHRQELTAFQLATTSAISAAEDMSMAILFRKTPDETATSYSMTGFGLALDKHRLPQLTAQPQIFRTNNRSASFILLTRGRLHPDAGGAEKVQSTVSRLRFFTDVGPLQTGNLNPPIEAVNERLDGFPVLEHQGQTEPSWKYAMGAHSFNVTEPGSSLHIALKELSRDVPVRLYLRRAELPSREEFDRNITLSPQGPDAPYSIAQDETTLLTQDRYTWFIPPDDVTAVGGPGEYTVGIEHVPYGGNVTDSPDADVEDYSHVNFTLSYKLKLFTTTCLSFNDTAHHWTTEGCRPCPLTTSALSHCYCTRLAAFSSGFTFYDARSAVIPLKPPTPECFPDVTLSGGGADQSAALAVERRVPLTIQSTLAISCNESYTVAFRWQLFHSARGRLEAVSLAVPATSADLSIPRNTLLYGLVKIELNATVSINRTGEQNSLQGQQWVEVLPAPLVALISGGSARAVGRRGTLVLNASSSYDPDGIIADSMDINFTWNCRTENGTFCAGVFGQDGNVPSFSFPVSSLPTESAIFNFSVQISSGSRTSAPYSQIVELKDGAVLNVLINCFVNCNDRINPSERLVLVTSCDNCPADAAYSWSLRDAPASFGRADLDWAAETATGRTSQDLVLKANVLTVPGEYTLRLDVISASGFQGVGGVGFTEALVNVNEPPTSGACSVSPASGTTTSTLFSVSCRGFQDSDRPLTYALYYNDGQTTAFRVLFSGPQSQLPPTLLPVGKESRDFNVTLQVRVSDAFGAVAYSNNMTVQVELPSAEETAAALGNLSSSLDSLLGSGNAQGVLQLASSIGSVLNTPSQGATNESKTAAQEARTQLVTALETVEVQTVDSINLLASALGQVTAAEDQVTPDAQVASSSIALKMSRVLSSQSVQDLGAEGLETSAGNVLNVVVNTLQASSTSATAQRLSGSPGEGTTQLAKNQQATTTMFGAMENVNGAILDRKTPDESRTAFEFGTFGLAVDKERCSVTSSAPKITRTSDASLNFFVVPATSTLLGGSCRGESAVGTENFQSKKNPYAYSGSSAAVQSAVNGLQVRGAGGPLAVTRLAEPVQIVTERAEGLPAATERGSTVPSWQQAMSMHSFNVTEEGSSVHVTVLSVEQNVSLRLYLRRNDRPTRADFDLNTTLPRPDDEIFTIQLGNNQSVDQSPFNWFISADDIVTVGGVGEFTVGVDHVPYAEAGRVDPGLQSEYSNVNFTTNYTMQIFTTTCLFFDEGTQEWKSDGCKAGPLTSDRLSHCFCDHLTSFGSGFTFFVAPNSLNILQALQGFLNIGENPAVVICISVIFGLYLLLVIWGRHKDNEDAKKVGATLLRASKRGHDSFYRIMVFTGPRSGAGTTARVHLKLLGELGEAGPVVLEDMDRVTFREGAVDTFVLSAGRLGALSAAHVWHDNTGGDPSWYLTKIVVTDCNNDAKYTFVCDKWLAVEEGDGQVDRLLTVATEKDLTSIGKVFSSKTNKDFRDGHLWFSVLGRPAYSSFTRVQRLSC
ncbi:uncharacterized protein [Branchiostoma lanceolatum]|uniref:uncharacterized protein n=1 Tax=Branchiostoma lanceolatum TaxID=7740 RepID=UPI003452A0F8